MCDPFSGAILAGGRSLRMGRDKAFLVQDGLTMVQRQAAVLRSVGCDEVLISGRIGVDYAVAGTRVVYDPVDGAGPLAGLVAALTGARNDWVLVLAVDLPLITAGFIKRLLAAGAGRTGAVPHGSHGYEPLAALYPRGMLAEATAALHRGEYSLQQLVARAEQSGLLVRFPLEEIDTRLLTNWNEPEAKSSHLLAPP